MRSDKAAGKREREAEKFAEKLLSSQRLKELVDKGTVDSDKVATLYKGKAGPIFENAAATAVEITGLRSSLLIPQIEEGKGKGKNRGRGKGKRSKTM